MLSIYIDTLEAALLVPMPHVIKDLWYFVTFQHPSFMLDNDC